MRHNGSNRHSNPRYWVIKQGCLYARLQYTDEYGKKREKYKKIERKIDARGAAEAMRAEMLRHAEKLYQIADLSEFDIAREILKKMEGGELGSKFTARDIYSKHWKRLSDPKEVNKGLEILVEYRQLHAIVHATAGRSKTVFINDRVE